MALQQPMTVPVFSRTPVPQSLSLLRRRPSSCRQQHIVAVFKSRTTKGQQQQHNKPRPRGEDGIFGTSGGIGFTKENELFVGRVAMLGFAPSPGRASWRSSTSRPASPSPRQSRCSSSSSSSPCSAPSARSATADASSMTPPASSAPSSRRGRDSAPRWGSARADRSSASPRPTSSSSAASRSSASPSPSSERSSRGRAPSRSSTSRPASPSTRSSRSSSSAYPLLLLRRHQPGHRKIRHRRRRRRRRPPVVARTLSTLLIDRWRCEDDRDDRAPSIPPSLSPQYMYA